MTLLMMRGKGCFGIVPLLMLILSGLAALTSCGARQGASPFDASGFHSDKYRVILYFDLRDDGQPGAGVVVNENTLQGVELRSLVLPFGSKSVRPSRALFSTWGMPYGGSASSARAGLVTARPRRPCNPSCQLRSAAVPRAAAGQSRTEVLRET